MDPTEDKVTLEVQRTLSMICINILGVILYAIGINCFASPHKIAPGGASGIAILVNYITKFPIGLFVFCFNIPLLICIVYEKSFSKLFILRTMITILLLSIITDYITIIVPAYKGNPLLASMFGGALMGIGLACVHLGASNTGGISLLGLIIQKIKPQFRVGTLLSALNMIVVVFSGIVYHNIDSLLYAVLMVYISGIFMDKVLGIASAKSLMIIIADCTDKVRELFVKEEKGITILKGEGGYSTEKQRVILCGATRNDCEQLQKQVKEVDPKALIIITEASKIEGKGFHHMI